MYTGLERAAETESTPQVALVAPATFQLHMRVLLPFLARCIRNTHSHKCSTTVRVVARQFAASQTGPVSRNTSRHYILSFLANLETINENDIRMAKVKEDWQITDEALESRESSQITICSPYIITTINLEGQSKGSERLFK